MTAAPEAAVRCRSPASNLLIMKSKDALGTAPAYATPQAAVESVRTQAARAEGVRLALNVENIWAPTEQLVQGFATAAREKAEQLCPPVKYSGSWAYFLGWVLFGTGLTALFIGGDMADSKSTGSQIALALWVVNSVIWLFVVWKSFDIYSARTRERVDLVERLSRTGLKAAAKKLDKRRDDARAYDPTQRRAATGVFTPAAPAPLPQLFGVSHEGAEHLVAQWMAHLGESDAQVTQFTGDGGIDVTSSHYIAQVKNYAGTVGVTEIREFAGVTMVDGRKPLFFTSGAYASGAVAFAEQAGIALFVYDAVGGTLTGANQAAEWALAKGL